MKDFGEHYYNEKEMNTLFDNAGFTDVNVKWCSFAHIDMIDPIFSLATRVEPFVEKRVPTAGIQYFCQCEKGVKKFPDSRTVPIYFLFRRSSTRSFFRIAASDAFSTPSFISSKLRTSVSTTFLTGV